MANQERSGKLVRDKIPDIIRGDGGDPRVVILDGSAYTSCLRAKLVEEVEELLSAPDDKRVEEAADVVEVLKAMVRDFGLDWDAVEDEGRRKRHERGGFEGQVWMEE